VAQIQISGSGYYEIYDPEHPAATFTVSAYIEVSDGDYFPCSSNPIASGINQGYIYAGSLTFNNVYPPSPPIPPKPYRVLIYVVRDSDSQVRTGVSYWADQYGLNPWSPDPIKVQQFN